MKVLIVDDEEDLRQLTRMVLERSGYEVVEASSGKEAIEIATGENAPRLILLDWMMPEMSGLEVCKVLRQPPAPFRYIILVTAISASEKSVGQAIQAGFNDYIEKPYSPETLLERVNVGRTLVELYGGLVQRLQAVGADIEEIRKAIGQPQD